MASYSAPAYEYKPTPASGSEGSKGTGATHTVIVAPTMGILRYVPFAMNASIGDTIKFKWGANNHTVTKSSSLTPCNKSSVEPFASGTQNQAFEFTQVVNSTDPVWYYCGTPGHCQKGMFGVINPPNAWGSDTCVSKMAGEMAKNDSDMAAMWSNMNKMTEGNDKAANWGSGINLKDIPDWAQKDMVENVMYTRNFLAANKDVLKDDGTIDLSGPAPMMFPADMSQALNGAASSAPASTASSTAASSSTVASSASASPSAAAATKNGASSLTSPKALIGFMAVAVTLFAL
jgi:plastocyanin